MKKTLCCIFILITCTINAQAPPGCSSTNDVAGNPGQAGLFGEYVAGYFSDNPSYFPSTIAPLNRIETNLNYTTNNWGAIVPPAGGTVADANSYSSRYRGSIYIATAGTYTFYLTSDDASYMWIDNAAIAYPTVVANALINNGGLHGDITISASFFLSAGFHNIQIQFGEQGGGNHLIFEYAATSPSIPRQVVPNNVLCTGLQPAIVVPPAAAPPGCNCSAGVTSQFYTGYFNDVQTYFTSNTSAINRIDPNLNYTTDGGWGNVCPPLAGSNASPETYSARFSGEIYVAAAGTYTFYLTSDDASFLWMDGNALVANPTTASALINNGGTHSAATVSASITLTAGLHDFKIHFGENTGNNVCYLEYQNTTLGINRQIIPQSAYCSCLSTANILPVELLDFTADYNQDGSILLKWETATELNNNRFEVERSNNGFSFSKIASLSSKGINGNSSSILHYQATDPEIIKEITYYRLKQIDNDGTSKLHKIISLAPQNTTNFSFSISPNPNMGKFSARISGINLSNKVKIHIHSVDGKVVYQQLLNTGTLNGNALNVDLDVRLNSGLYIVNFEIDGVLFPLKMIVE